MPRTCPFCSLLCDDYFADPGFPTSTNLHCPRAAMGLDALADWDRNRLFLRDPQQVERTARRVARQMTAARRPLILVGGCDAGAARCLVDLARQTGSVLASQWPARIPSGYTATLEEVRTRSDCVVVVGDVPRQMPLLVERFLSGPPRLRSAGTPRHAFHLDTAGAAHSSLVPQLRRIQTGDLLAFVVAARARESGGLVGGGGSLAGPVGQMQQHISGASHVAMLWSVDVPPQLAAALEDWARLVRRTRHCVTLRLDPQPGRASFHNVCSWTTGFQPPIDFAVSPGEEMSYAQLSRALRAGVYDAALAVNPHAAAPLRIPAGRDRATILLDSPLESAVAEAAEPDAVRLVPDGHYFRGDGVAMLKAGGLIDGVLTLRQMTQAILAAVAKVRQGVGVTVEGVQGC